MARLIADGARVIFSTSFDHDPFLLAMAKKNPDVVFRQASVLASDDNPPNVSSQNALIHQGHYVNGVAAELSSATNTLGFVAGPPRHRAAECEFVFDGSPPDQSRCEIARRLHPASGSMPAATRKR